MHITVVTGTARIDNVSQRVAQAVATAIRDHDVQVTEVAVGDLLEGTATVPPWGAGGADSVPTKWKEVVATTDRFVFVLPEYNHSFPGEWKLLMDSLFAEYKGKGAYVVAVGGGQFAGARVMEHVMPVLVNFQFAVANDRLHIAHASRTFPEDGSISDAPTAERVTAFAQSVAGV